MDDADLNHIVCVDYMKEQRDLYWPASAGRLQDVWSSFRNCVRNQCMPVTPSIDPVYVCSRCFALIKFNLNLYLWTYSYIFPHLPKSLLGLSIFSHYGSCHRGPNFPVAVATVSSVTQDVCPGRHGVWAVTWEWWAPSHPRWRSPACHCGSAEPERSRRRSEQTLREGEITHTQPPKIGKMGHSSQPM